jgi:hypothetical protein
VLLVEAFLAAEHQEGMVSFSALASFFHSMLRLFSVGRATDLESERQGLWGELFVMSRVRGFLFWAPFWHLDATRTFDFSAPGKRVEVKTVTGQERLHYFSHRQVFALEGEEIVIASLLLRREDAGLSLKDLIVQCHTALLGTPYYMKLYKAIRRAGMEDPAEPGPIFDADDAGRALAWFRSEDIPHFSEPEPPGVSQTRYRVNLSGAPQIATGELEAWLDSWAVKPAHRVASQVGLLNS